ncbi:hypothetical protein [Paraburkholderia atlantica]|uniref:Uncharacterized protein n=1 Tax=Paraburkholderia atlantica TaxID=2654982 RepID=D5WNH6_PARAM|nr:hypothetical protein [Paraburkholderia atlantica]ADG20855.1 conserved hypothetical protein [Paraburkholderia atlantica]MBB5510931.1 hypothetical protein [Paraburkholderia atlantica]
MDWSKVASTISGTAPLLAGLIGGPVGLGVTAASTILSHVLGTANDPTSVSAALEDPAALDKVRQAESANAIQLQQLAVTAAQAQLTHEIELARVEAADRADARAKEEKTGDWVPKALAMAVTVGFFGMLILMAVHGLPDKNRDLINVILGSLGTAWVSIIGYYFGTSAGSARKTELLAKPNVPIPSTGLLTLRAPVQAALSAATGEVPMAAAAQSEGFLPLTPGGQGPVYGGP